MSDISSNGAGGGNWNVGASWAGGVAPGAGDDVTILNGDAIALTGNESSRTIRVDSGGTYTDAGNKLTVVLNFDFDAGATINSTGILDHTGSGTGANPTKANAIAELMTVAAGQTLSYGQDIYCNKLTTGTGIINETGGGTAKIYVLYQGNDAFNSNANTVANTDTTIVLDGDGSVYSQAGGTFANYGCTFEIADIDLGTGANWFTENASVDFTGGTNSLQNNFKSNDIYLNGGTLDDNGNTVEWKRHMGINVNGLTNSGIWRALGSGNITNPHNGSRFVAPEFAPAGFTTTTIGNVYCEKIKLNGGAYNRSAGNTRMLAQANDSLDINPATAMNAIIQVYYSGGSYTQKSFSHVGTGIINFWDDGGGDVTMTGSSDLNGTGSVEVNDFQIDWNGFNLTNAVYFKIDGASGRTIYFRTGLFSMIYFQKRSNGGAILEPGSAEFRPLTLFSLEDNTWNHDSETIKFTNATGGTDFDTDGNEVHNVEEAMGTGIFLYVLDDVVVNNWTGTSGNIDITASKKIYIKGDLYNSGIATTPNGIWEFIGTGTQNWTKGNNYLYNVIINKASGKAILSGGGSVTQLTMTLGELQLDNTNTLTATDFTGNGGTMKSDSGGTRAAFTVTNNGAANITGMTFQDIDATGGPLIALNCTDGGNNLFISFVNTPYGEMCLLGVGF